MLQLDHTCDQHRLHLQLLLLLLQSCWCRWQQQQRIGWCLLQLWLLLWGNLQQLRLELWLQMHLYQRCCSRLVGHSCHDSCACLTLLKLSVWRVWHSSCSNSASSWYTCCYSCMSRLPERQLLR